MKNAGIGRMVQEERFDSPEVDTLRRFREGSEEAFTAIVRRYQGSLVGFFVRLGADVHEAEDCAQETFLRLYRCRARYLPLAPFRSFLYRVAYHAWVDRRRRAAREPSVGMGPAALVEMTVRLAPSDRIDLRAALQDLPDPLRCVVVLSVDEGLSYREIAGVLDIPVGTVKSRMFHAVRRLREVLHARVEP